MEINDFVKNFAELFEESASFDFKPSTKFRSIEEWSSLLALSVIAMVDEKYNIKLRGDDIRNAETIEDIFKIIKLK
jgi:acyl carrier protein